ncbi:PAS domain S-box protein [Spirulina subsalsa FACHB-351]|uniref:histidine kinase n=1 Tax=Spirulina subsalsa FACHB-351 TaxID=234711 RepID=A0ABT3L056_9CYAN|nr:PAS domain S-box protein [Spirulina subsalsa]MCW6034881.1 PAS domain S-box protein [Spirulina subsalsa FACHB-351]
MLFPPQLWTQFPQCRDRNLALNPESVSTEVSAVDFLPLDVDHPALKTLFTQAFDAILIADDQGQYRAANPAACQLFGIAPSALVGRSISDFTTPDFNFEQVWQQFLNQGEAQGEFFLIREDGEIRTIEYRATANFLPHLHLSILRDITARVFNEAEMQAMTVQEHPLQSSISDQEIRAELDLEQFFNISLDLLCIADNQGRFRRLNRAWENILGYALSELEGKPFLELVHPDDIDATLAAMADLDADHTVLHFVNRYRAKNGEYRAIEWSSAPSGEFTYAAARDITERLATEQALEALVNRSNLLNKISTEIRNSLDLETILQNAVNAIVTELNVDVCAFGWFRPEAVPPSWELVQEQKRVDLPSWLGCYKMEDFPLVANHIFEEKIHQFNRHDSTEIGLTEFCEEVGVDFYLILPIHTAGGQIGGFELGRVGTDKPWQEDEIELLQRIGDQVAIAIYQAQLYQESQGKTVQLEQAYQELQQAQTQLIQGEKMSSLGQLVAGIAHEINNPVSFIYGNINHMTEYIENLLDLIALYQQNYPQPKPVIIDQIESIDLDFILADLPKVLDSMKTGAARIRDIIRSLRTFSKLDEAELKPIDLHDNIDSTLVILENKISGRAGNCTIEVIKHYGDLPLVECYGGLLNQVFMDLLINGIDAIIERDNMRDLEGGQESYQGQLTITTTVGDNNQVVITIEDNGVGMIPEVQAQIFNPFFTTKPVGKGTGMGLATSYQIVTQNHGGSLTCSSVYGQGSCFVIELPL